MPDPYGISGSSSGPGSLGVSFATSEGDSSLEDKAESRKSGKLFAWEDGEKHLLLADADEEGFIALRS